MLFLGLCYLRFSAIHSQAKDRILCTKHAASDSEHELCGADSVKVVGILPRGWKVAALLMAFAVVQLLSHAWLFCDPMDCGPPDSSVLGISQARILEWVAISFSQPRDLPDPGINPHLLHWQADSLLLSHQGNIVIKFSSVAQSCLTLCYCMDWSMPGLPVHHQTPRVYSNSCPLSWWCHPAISSSVIPLSFCLQSFPASGSFQMSQFFASRGQRIGVSASTSVLPMNTQD